ncbi:MAG: peptidase T [Patescibacteria group bacterium]
MGVGVPTRDELLAESVAEKFRRYVRIDTRADDGSKTCPSSPGQLALAEMLKDELIAMGVPDARVDRFGFVYASLPGNRPHAPAIGFLAHLDTAQGVPGGGVKPILHRAYSGGTIELPGGVRIQPAELPELQRLKGHDLITSDGTTLLGADDKAGVAEIMSFVARLLAEPHRAHGPIKLAFTPDEEIGRGIEHFDAAGFGAVCAYTVDGGEAGEYEEENFNAETLAVTLYGVSSHTGTARGRMVNAVAAAAELVAGIPPGMRPETTDGRLGFMHPDAVEGDVERVTLRWLLRDFTVQGLEAKRRLLHASLRLLACKYPGLRTRVRVAGAYSNMREKIEADPRVSGHALAAIRKAGLEPIVKPIRGGTDGARLSQLGLPTPNLFNGGLNVHSRRELVSVQWMEQAVEVLLHLAELWAGESVTPHP